MFVTSVRGNSYEERKSNTLFSIDQSFLFILFYFGKCQKKIERHESSTYPIKTRSCDCVVPITEVNILS